MFKKIILGLLFCVVLLTLFSFLRPSLILSKQDVKTKYALPASHFVMWRGAEIHYVDEGSGMPLLMIHGFGGSHRNFNKISDLLKDDFRVIRIDLPGFGMSDLPAVDEKNPHFAQLYSDFMTFMLDTLKLDSVYIMGNSMGGWMALETAVNHPEKVKKLALMGSAGYDMKEISAKAVKWLRFSIVEKALKRGMPLSFSKDAAVRCWANDSLINPAEIKANNDFWNREGNIHNAFLLASSGETSDTVKITGVTGPTLIVWGKQDEIVPLAHAYRFQRDIKDCRLIIYEPCGHIPMVEKGEELEKDFLKFCEKTDGFSN